MREAGLSSGWPAPEATHLARCVMMPGGTEKRIRSGLGHGDLSLVLLLSGLTARPLPRATCAGMELVPPADSGRAGNWESGQRLRGRGCSVAAPSGDRSMLQLRLLDLVLL